MVEQGQPSKDNEADGDNFLPLKGKDHSREIKLQTLQRLIAEGDDSGNAEPLDMESIKAEGWRARQALKA